MDFENNNISRADLIKAFQPEEQPEKNKKEKKDKKLITSISVFVLGVITLVVGVVFLVMRLNTAPAVDDAKQILSVGSWTKEGSPEVIWTFTEIGKGTLTTNNHLNDYEFDWMIEGDRFLIRTEWLYTMDDEFEYTLDQNSNTLTLTPVGSEEDADIVFRPAVDM